jgi:L-2,4-diaminobutyrate decarboxylase
MVFDDDALTLINELTRYENQAVAGHEPAISLAPMKGIVEELALRTYVEHGGLTGEEFARFARKYLQATTRLHHPGSLAHQVAVPHHMGALGAMLGAFTNNPMAIYEMGPAGAAIEFFVINWLLEKVGWPPAPYGDEPTGPEIHGAGVLTHGGSLANLTALVAARTRLIPEIWQDGSPGDLALLAPAESHYSVARAAGILGIGASSIYSLEIGTGGTVLPDRVLPVLRRLESDGKRALALVANACSTSVGRYDPLRELGELCRLRNIWFHVDGAHGAAALLSRRHRCLLDGVELADSLSWDAHKLMRTPGLCTAILVREAWTLDQAFHQQASYLFHEKEQPGIDFIQRSVECTKSGLGLKLFTVLGALGESGLADYVDRQFALARQSYDLLLTHPDFECALEPQSNILCFRIRGTDNLQLAVRDELIAEGDFHLSTAVFSGRRFLRAVFMSPHTSIAHVEQLVERIRAIAPRHQER